MGVARNNEKIGYWGVPLSLGWQQIAFQIDHQLRHTCSVSFSIAR
jgi:hypothetical protein